MTQTGDSGYDAAVEAISPNVVDMVGALDQKGLLVTDPVKRVLAAAIIVTTFHDAGDGSELHHSLDDLSAAVSAYMEERRAATNDH